MLFCFIHEITRSQFTDCVIITVVRTFPPTMGSDKVISVKDVRVGEFDTPFIIIKRNLDEIDESKIDIGEGRLNVTDVVIGNDGEKEQN